MAEATPEQMAQWPGGLDPLAMVYPREVQPPLGGPEQKLRWDVCVRVMVARWEGWYPGGTMDASDKLTVRHMAMELYKSNVPLGSPDDIADGEKRAIAESWPKHES